MRWCVSAPNPNYRQSIHTYSLYFHACITFNKYTDLVSLLSSERTAFGQLGLTTGRSAQYSGTVVTGDSSLGVGEHGGDVQTSLALDVHEI